jgi:hypothetical protein
MSSPEEPDVLNENEDYRRRRVTRSLFTVPILLSLIPSSLVGQIQDNSFLLEEAYNQEMGVVQHISTFARSSRDDWGYSFTQEWPLGGIQHQLSYTIPLEHSSGTGTGLGDIALNYRHQLVGNPEARTVLAPRVSLLFPTGSEEDGRGTGGVGIQANLPLTIVPSPKLATHWNAGFTLVPSAQGSGGATATTFSRNVGGSAVWLVRPAFNLLVEMVWLSEGAVAGSGSTRVNETLLLSPGMRAAFDVSGGLQIVPGVAYIIGLTEESGENALFLYLSLEHPFTRQ